MLSSPIIAPILFHVNMCLLSQNEGSPLPTGSFCPVVFPAGLRLSILNRFLAFLRKLCPSFTLIGNFESFIAIPVMFGVRFKATFSNFGYFIQT